MTTTAKKAAAKKAAAPKATTTAPPPAPVDDEAPVAGLLVDEPQLPVDVGDEDVPAVDEFGRPAGVPATAEPTERQLANRDGA